MDTVTIVVSFALGAVFGASVALSFRKTAN